MQWFIGRDGKESGPVTFSDLSERARDGRLRRDDLVWCQGMQNREVAEQIPGLWASPEASETSGPDQSDPSQSQSQAVPSEPITTEPPQSDVSAAKADLRPMKKSNFIVRHWRGELPLPVSYWILVVLLGLVVVYLCGVAADALAAVDIGPLAIGLYVVALITLLLAITAWQLVGTWRSAGNYMKSSKTPFWGGLARFVVIIACIRAAVDFYTLAGPMLSAGVNLALRGDDTPAYQLRLLEGGKEVELSGGMPYGTADALKAILDAGPDIKLVHLNSDGGWIVEGEKIARMIRSRKIDTFTSTECSSACTIAFLGGTSRYLSSKGRLGFHSASFGSIDAKDVPEFNDDFRRSLRAYGAPSWFINKAMRTSSTSMWYPTHKELKTAGIITHSVDATSTATVEKSFDIAEIQRTASPPASSPPMTLNKLLIRAAKKFNRQLPIDHGNGTTTVRAWIENDEWHYLKVAEGDYSVLTTEGLAEAEKFEQNFVQTSLCKDEKIMKFVRKGAKYVWHITDQNGFEAYRLRLDSETCPQHRHASEPMRKKQGDRAIADYDKAIAYFNRGLAYQKKGEVDLAIANYTKATKLNPNDFIAYYNRGKAYNEKGDYDRTIADLTKAIKLKPKLAQVYNNRGAVYDSKGEVDRAIADYTKAIALNPKYATAYSNRGVAYGSKGAFDRAIADYTKAIALKPNVALAYTLAYTNRGYTYEKKGDKEQAIADYRKVLEIDPSDQIAKNNLKRLGVTP